MTATRLRSAVVAALCLLLPLAAQAAGTRISAAVDKTSVRVGETLRLTLTVETDPRGGDDAATVTPPDLSAWQVVSQQQRQTYINGRSDQRLVLGLQALQPGRVEIDPFTLRADGKTLKSQSFTILVVGSGAPQAAMPQLMPAPSSEAPARPTTLPAGAYDELAFLAWDVDRDAVWLGQPLVATLWVYVNAATSVQESELGNIELEGFWRESRPAQRGGETVSIRNTRFVRSPVAQYVLVPLRAGTLALPSVRGDFVLGERSLFGSGRRQKATRQGPALAITVKPLPEAGRPADFRGPAVGQVRLEASLNETQVDADHGVELTATTTVDGHLDHVPVPRLETPDFEVYPPTNTEQRAQQGGRLMGQRVTRWQLRPRKLGALTIPALRLPYFDPSSGTWQTAVTVPLSVSVSGQLAAPATAAAPAAPAPSASKPSAALTSDVPAPPALRPVRRTSDLSPPQPPWSSHPLFALAVVLPPLALGADAVRAAMSRRRDRGAGARAVRQAASQAHRALAELTRTPQAREGFTALSRALLAFLETRLSLSLRGQTHDKTRALLVERGVQGPLADAVVTELENCEFARFAPEANRGAVLAEGVQRVRALIDRIDGGRVVRRERRTMAQRVATALLAASIAAPCVAWSADARYDAAVSALDAGRAAEAATRFAELARETDAPDAWYALGTAELTAGRYGRAIWALEQAHAAAPDDADVQHNLDAARALVLRSAAAYAGEQRTVLPGDDDMGTGLVTALAPDLVAGTFAGAWVLFFGLWATSRRAAGTPRGVRAGLATVGAGLVALVFGGLLVGRAVVLRAATYGVVVERFVDAREGPGPQYATTARLLSGVKVRVRGADAAYTHVTLPDGSTGWVETRAVEALTDR